MWVTKSCFSRTRSSPAPSILQQHLFFTCQVVHNNPAGEKMPIHNSTQVVHNNPAGEKMLRTYSSGLIWGREYTRNSSFNYLFQYLPDIENYLPPEQYEQQLAAQQQLGQQQFGQQPGGEKRTGSGAALSLCSSGTSSESVSESPDNRKAGAEKTVSFFNVLPRRVAVRRDSTFWLLVFSPEGTMIFLKGETV